MNVTTNCAPDRGRVIAICLLLALGVWVVFGQTVHFESVNYDDDILVFEHPVIKQGLSLKGIVWVFTHSDDGHWTPLNKISHMLDFSLFGREPGGHHFTNLLLHALTVIFLFLGLRQMTQAVWPSAFVAAVFAIHPLRVESVVWIAERKDVLSGFFFMLALWAYARYVGRNGLLAGAPASGRAGQMLRPPASVDYGMALLFFTCGMLSKAIVATFPIILLILDHWPLGRFRNTEYANSRRGQTRWSVIKPILLEKIPFVGIIIGVGVGLLFSRDKNDVVVLEALRMGRAMLETHFDSSAMVRAAHTCWTPLIYIQQMFFPVKLVVLTPPDEKVSYGGIVAALGLLLAVSVTVFALRSKRPYLLAGWLWYLVLLAPVLVLMQQGFETRCDRYTYLPQIGLYLALGWAARDLFGHRRGRSLVLGAGVAAVLIALMVTARAQAKHWRDSFSLWTHTLAYTTGNATAHNNLGMVLAARGEGDSARQHFQTALQIQPDYPQACNNLGAALLAQEKAVEAVTYFERALKFRPGFAPAYNNLGHALMKLGKLPEASSACAAAIQLNPSYAEAYYNLGNILSRQGRSNEAIQNYETSLRLRPDAADVHYDLAVACAAQGELDRAIVHYEHSLRLRPEFPDALINLGVARASKGQAAEAIRCFERALAVDPQNAAAHHNLGVALVSQQKFAAATAHFNTALRIKPDYLEARIQLGSLAAAQGNKAEAIVQLESAMDLALAQNNSSLAELLRVRLDSLRAQDPRIK